MVPLMTPVRGSFPESASLWEVQIPRAISYHPHWQPGLLDVPLPDTNVPEAGGPCSCRALKCIRLG